MQELREGLKKLLEQRREAAQALSDLEEKIEHVNKALGVGDSAKARKPRGPNKKKAVDGQVAQVDFSDLHSQMRQE